MKKKIIILIIAIFLLAVVFISFNTFHGSYETSSTVGMDINYESILNDENRRVSLPSADESIIDLRTAIKYDKSYKDMTFNFKVYFSKGICSVKIYDATDNLFSESDWDGTNDGWYLNTEDYELVLSEEYTENGEYTIDLSQLEEDHEYYIAFYCSEDAVYQFRYYISWKSTLFRYIYNKFYERYTDGGVKYTPLIITE